MQFTNQTQNGVSDTQSIENPLQNPLNPSIGTLPPRQNLPTSYRQTLEAINEAAARAVLKAVSQ